MVRIVLLSLALIVVGCGGDATEADRIGVGAQCNTAGECESPEGFELECLTQFTGGYCGLEGCLGDDDCPEGSACATSDDGKNYCYRLCADKQLDCNRNRSPENEANCVGSGTINFVDGGTERKACEPPSSGF